MRERRVDGIGRLLLLARRDFLARIERKVREGGHDVMPDSWHAMLPFIDLEGTRSSQLAQRAGISKQAVGKIVRELEAQQLLKRAPDPEDGRSFLVQFTERGIERLQLVHRLIEQIEREYEAMLGVQQMHALRRSLRRIASDRANTE